MLRSSSREYLLKLSLCTFVDIPARILDRCAPHVLRLLCAPLRMRSGSSYLATRRIDRCSELHACPCSRPAYAASLIVKWRGFLSACISCRRLTCGVTAAIKRNVRNVESLRRRDTPALIESWDQVRAQDVSGGTWGFWSLSVHRSGITTPTNSILVSSAVITAASVPLYCT